MARVRRVPQRTCVGCGEVQGKRELLRIVRTPEGEVVLDVTGKRNGRGAYVHRNAGCLEQALRGRLAHALRCEVGPEAAASLRQGFEEVERAAAAAARRPQVHRATVPPPGLHPRGRQ